MNVQHLRYFLTVMDIGSVSCAADAMGVTQPTLSAALKRLEREFGLPLFVRDGRGIRPLRGAKLLDEKIRQAVRVLSTAKHDLNGGILPRLRIGLLSSLAEVWISRLLSTWDGPVEIVESLPHELEKQLSRGTIDLALTALPVRPAIFHKVLLREPYAFFVGPMHQFAERKTVQLSDLNQQPFVLRQCCEAVGTGRRLLTAAGVRFKVVAKTKQEATAAAIVSSGIGCTLAPASWLRPGIHAVEVSDLPLKRTVALAWKSKNNARVAAFFIKKLKT